MRGLQRPSGDLAAEVAAAEAVDGEVDGRVDRHHHVADVRHVATRAVEGLPQRRARLQGPEGVRHERCRVTDDGDDDHHRDGDGDGVRRRAGRVGGAQPAETGAEAGGATDDTQQAGVQHDEESHRGDVHDEREEEDAVTEDVEGTQREGRALHRVPDDAMLEAARCAEDESRDAHDGHPAVGPASGAEAVCLQGPTHGDVAVDGEKDRDEGIDEPDDVTERVDTDEEAREGCHVGVQGARVRVQYDDAALKQRAHQDENIDDGQTPQ